MRYTYVSGSEAMVVLTGLLYWPWKGVAAMVEARVVRVRVRRVENCILMVVVGSEDGVVCWWE